jgi:hypothetical protein
MAGFFRALAVVQEDLPAPALRRAGARVHRLRVRQRRPPRLHSGQAGEVAVDAAVDAAARYSIRGRESD